METFIPFVSGNVNCGYILSLQVDQSDIGSPLRDITEADLRNHGECYELLALLSFTDNRTSRTVEVCRRYDYDSTWSMQKHDNSQNLSNINIQYGISEYVCMVYLNMSTLMITLVACRRE